MRQAFIYIFIYLLSKITLSAQEKISIPEDPVTDKTSLFELVKLLEKDSVQHKGEYDTDESFNPLGPKAQVIRTISYKQANQEGNLTDSGFWIKKRKAKFLYKNQRLYTPGIAGEYKEIDIKTCNSDIRLAVKKLIRLETESAYAKNIIRTLQNSENTFVLSLVNITESYMLLPLPDDRLGFLNNNAYAFQVMERNNLMVGYAPFDRIGSGAEIRWTPRLGIMTLAHELSHAFDANYGLLDDRLIPDGYGEVMSAREIRALFHENTIRQEMKKKLRIDLNTGRAFLWEGKPYTYPLPALARY